MNTQLPLLTRILYALAIICGLVAAGWIIVAAALMDAKPSHLEQQITSAWNQCLYALGFWFAAWASKLLHEIHRKICKEK